jgi:hypothetical protein
VFLKHVADSAEANDTVVAFPYQKVLISYVYPMGNAEFVEIHTIKPSRPVSSEELSLIFDALENEGMIREGAMLIITHDDYIYTWKVMCLIASECALVLADLSQPALDTKPENDNRLKYFVLVMLLLGVFSWLLKQC